MLFVYALFVALVALSASVLADPGAVPNNIPLEFDTASRRYVAAVIMGSGSQPQTANFTISTGLRYSAVASTQCASCVQDGDRVYNPELSSSFQAVSGSAEAIYGDLDLSGGLSREDCKLVSANPKTPWAWPNQTLVMSNGSQSALSFFSQSITGVMGLGTSAPAGGSVNDTVLGSWFSTHPKNTTFQYGMALNDLASTISQGISGNAGQLHMLAPNTSFFNESQLTWAPANTQLIGANTGSGAGAFPSDFAFTLEGWTFRGPADFTISSGESATATFEPLFPALIFPSRYANAIYASIPGAQPIRGQDPMQWTVPCTTIGISWVPLFGSLQLPMGNLILKSADGSCVGAIEGWSDETVNDYLLGSAFMSNAYIIHETSRSGKNQVGIAPRLVLEPRSAKSKGALIGGLVGGILGAIIIFLLALLFWYKKAHRKERTLYNETAAVQPFVAAPTTPSTSDPFTSPPGSGTWSSSGRTESTFAQQQAAAMREAKGRQLFTLVSPPPTSRNSEYAPSTSGASSSPVVARSPLLPPAYE